MEATQRALAVGFVKLARRLPRHNGYRTVSGMMECGVEHRGEGRGCSQV